MKAYSLALLSVLNASAVFDYCDAFTPTTLIRTATLHVASAPIHPGLISPHLNFLRMSNFIGMDDDDEDDDDIEDDDDEDDYLRNTEGDAISPFTGLVLDPRDANQILRPRPSIYFPEESEDPLEPDVKDEDFVQTMTDEERTENLKIMRQIYLKDLPDLMMRRDSAGYLQANKDLKRREKKDPFFLLNTRLKEAIKMGEPEEKVKKIRDLMEKTGGPPGDLEIGWRGYVEINAIYFEEEPLFIRESRLEAEIRKQNIAQNRALAAQARRNELKEKKQLEEDMKNPMARMLREEKEANEANFALRKRLAEMEEDRRKEMDKRTKELLGRVPDLDTDPYELKKAIEMGREDMLKIVKKQLGQIADDGDEEDSRAGSSKSRKKKLSRSRETSSAEVSGGRPRLPGDNDVTRGELGDMKLESSSSTDTGPLTVEVTSEYNKDQSDPPMRKHCFRYTIRITNNSPEDTIQLLGRRFEIQTVGSGMKDVVQGEGVTGRQPILKPGEVFEYTSTAPLSVRPIGPTIIAARMRGEYRYVTLAPGQDTATEDQVKSGGDASAELGMFHFIFPEDQRVIPYSRSEDEDDEDDEDDEEDDDTANNIKTATVTKTATNPAPSLPGDDDMKSGNIKLQINDCSDTVSENVRVQVNSSYRPERSDSKLDKHCFAYNIRITNESRQNIQLVSRRFEIQTIGSVNKDVVQGPGVTGRQPILKPGESFEYTSTAPLSVKPMQETPVVARMQGEYNFVQLGEDGTTPLSSTPLQAKLGIFHFILPALDPV